MKKILGVIVLFAFIFSSCATAPVVAPVVNHKNKNTATFAVKGFERFGILDLKASDPTDNGGKGTEEEKPSFSIGEWIITALMIGAGLTALGYGTYLAVTNPD
jgi:PBP1b-binding outer membrane lipoprotein LpoB